LPEVKTRRIRIRLQKMTPGQIHKGFEVNCFPFSGPSAGGPRPGPPNQRRLRQSSI